MAWTTPRTWTTDEVVTKAIMDTHIRDNLNYLKGRIDATLTNKSGSNLTAGAVIIFDGSNDNAFTTTTTELDRRVLGVITEDIDNEATGNVLVAGIASVQVLGTVARMEALITSTTAGKAKGSGNYSMSPGCIGFALEAGTDTTITAMIAVRHVTSSQPAKGYVSGGYSGAANLQDTDEYDPDTWTSKTSMPSPARDEHTFRGGGTSPLFAMGGYNGGSLSDNDEYDPDTWTSRTALLAAVRHMYGGHSEHNGGQVALDRGDSNLDEYSVSGDSWTNKLGSARANAARGAGLADGNMYEFGGDAAGGGTTYAIDDVDEYDFAGTFTSKSLMPGDREWMHGGAVDNTTCVAHGGESSGVGTYDSTFLYDPDTWSTGTSSGTTLNRHAMFDIGSLMYICYGNTASQAAPAATAATKEYDPSGDSFTAKTNGPSPSRYDLAGGSI
jgi:hypothetical protein